MTEIVTGLRQLLDLKRIQQVNSQNAVIIRDTPDKLAIAEKIIHRARQRKTRSRDTGRGAPGTPRSRPRIGACSGRSAAISFVNSRFVLLFLHANKLPLNKLLLAADYT